MKPDKVRHDPIFMREHWESEATGYILERQFSAADAKVVETLQLKPGERLLEIGFGSCVTAPAIISAHPGISYYGLDLANKFIEIGRSQKLPRAHFLKGSAAQLPFKHGSIDAILEMDAIHHFPKEYLTGVLIEILRALRPAGRLLVVEDWAAPPENERERLMDSLQRRRYLTRRGWEYHPSEKEWMAMLERAGLHLVHLDHIARPLNFGRFDELNDSEAQKELARLRELWGQEQPTTKMSLFYGRKG
jgi:ubiquinone/menaquinone biosynthesis C-methylase UbiE